MFSLPTDFISRIKEFPSAYADAIIARIDSSNRVCFRKNTLSENDSSSSDSLLKSLNARSHKVYGFDYFSIDDELKESLTRNKDLGSIFYIQNPSSMLPPLVLNPSQNQRILDLAAAPGSKTSLLAALMNNTGHIAAVEIVKKRFFKLKANLNRLNVTNTKVFWQNGEVVGHFRPNHFDSVMLDAPCSSEAIFHHSDSKSTKHWSINKVHEMSHKQNALLSSAIESCVPGGQVIYSTCSFSIEENELILEKILTKFPNVKLSEFDLSDVEFLDGFEVSSDQEKNNQLKKAKRIVPNSLHEGFFIAKLVKD